LVGDSVGEVVELFVPLVVSCIVCGVCSRGYT